jgi:hypothetical protein
MTRTTVLSLAAAFGFAATLAAQTTTSTATPQRDRMSDSKNEVTITGCLSRGADGKYMLTNAYMDKAGTTTTTAGSTTTAGTTGSATTPARSEHAMTWRLEGGNDLDRHVGHKIQVTGHTDWKESDRTGSNPPTSTATTGTTAGAEQRDRRTTTDMNQPKLDVTSVKMISSSCS